MMDFIPELSVAAMVAVIGASFGGVAGAATIKFTRAVLYVVACAIAGTVLFFTWGTGEVPGAGKWVGLALVLLFAAGGAIGFSIAKLVGRKFRTALAAAGVVVLLGAGSVGAIAKFVGLYEGVSTEGIQPPAEVAEQVVRAVQQSVIDSFSIAAANGKYTRTPNYNHPVSNLAAYIFNTTSGAALQPGLRVSAAMSATFAAPLENVRLLPVDELTTEFEVVGTLHLIFAAAAEGMEDKQSTADVRVSARGTIDDRRRLAVVNTMEVVTNGR